MSRSTGPRSAAQDFAAKAGEIAELVADKVADATSEAASKAAHLAGGAAHAATPYVEKAGEQLEETAVKLGRRARRAAKKSTRKASAAASKQAKIAQAKAAKQARKGQSQVAEVAQVVQEKGQATLAQVLTAAGAQAAKTSKAADKAAAKAQAKSGKKTHRVRNLLIIGAVAGVLLPLAIDLLEKLKIDDAVGAAPVHLVNGVWGIIAIGLFAEPSLTPFAGNVKAGFGGLLIPGGSADILITQIIGSAATIIWCAVTAVIMFGALKAIGRLRVNPKAEMEGNFIDNYEHGESVWPDILPLPGDAPAPVPVRSTAPATGD